MWPFKKKIKEDWKLVKTLEASFNWTDLKVEEKIYYYLYESNFGNRSVEVKEIGYCEMYKKGREHPYYRKVIYPWSKGADDSDIPSYWDIVKNKHAEHIQELYRRVLKFDVITNGSSK